MFGHEEPSRDATLAGARSAARDRRRTPAGRGRHHQLGNRLGEHEPPADNPGFERVGVPAVASVVYLGNGWVLTANHVGDTDVTLGGVVYPRVPGSRITFTNPDLSVPDLSAYRIDPHPELSILPIRASTPPNGTPVVMIGHGVNRAGPVTWGEYTGFIDAAGQTIRWGTNVVDGAGMLEGSAAFATVFDPAVSADEAQGAYGDSGGAVYAKNAQGAWELAGIMFTVGGYEEQPYNYHLEGNVTYAIDLAAYRDQIIAAVRPSAATRPRTTATSSSTFRTIRVARAPKTFPRRPTATIRSTTTATGSPTSAPIRAAGTEAILRRRIPRATTSSTTTATP